MAWMHVISSRLSSVFQRPMDEVKTALWWLPPPPCGRAASRRRLEHVGAPRLAQKGQDAPHLGLWVTRELLVAHLQVALRLFPPRQPRDDAGYPFGRGDLSRELDPSGLLGCRLLLHGAQGIPRIADDVDELRVGKETKQVIDACDILRSLVGPPVCSLAQCKGRQEAVDQGGNCPIHL